MERKRTSRASWVRPRWVLDPRIVCVCGGQNPYSPTFPPHDYSIHLSRAGNAQRGDHGIGTVTSIGRQHPLDKMSHLDGVEDIELRCLLSKDACEGELFDGATPIRRGVQSDMRWTRGLSLFVAVAGLGCLDGEDAVRGGNSWRRWPQTQVDLEEVVGSSIRRVHLEGSRRCRWDAVNRLTMHGLEMVEQSWRVGCLTYCGTRTRIQRAGSSTVCLLGVHGR